MRQLREKESEVQRSAAKDALEQVELTRLRGIGSFFCLNWFSVSNFKDCQSNLTVIWKEIFFNLQYYFDLTVDFCIVICRIRLLKSTGQHHL